MAGNGVVYLEHCSRQEAEQAIRGSDFTVIPFGSFEQHGSHLPLGTDSMLARGILEAAAAILSARKPPVTLAVMPVYPFGMSPEHSAFPGTVTLSRKTFFQFVEETARQLYAAGAGRLVLFNCHGGNTPYLQIALREIRQRSASVPLLIDVYSLESIQRYAEGIDYHAGRVETALMQILFPDEVRSVGPAAQAEQSPPPDERERFLASAAVPWFSDDFSSGGVIGNPEAATPELGTRILSDLTGEIADIFIRGKKLLDNDGQITK